MATLSKKRLYLYLFLLAIAISAMFLLRGVNRDCDSVRDYPEMEGSGYINIATDYNTIGYYALGDSIVGFQYEMIKSFEKFSGLRVNIFLETSLETSLQKLMNREYDVVARNIPINTELMERVKFTNPIVLSKNVLIQRKANYNNGIEPIRNHLELAKKKIYLPVNSPSILRINNLSQEIGDTIFIHEDSLYESEQLIMLVASGEIDYTVADIAEARKMYKLFPEIDIDTAISFTQIHSWAVRDESSALCDKINEWLENYKNSFEYKSIYEKYYSK